MKSWKRIEPTIKSRIGYRTVISKTFILPNGKVFDFQTYDNEDQEYAGVIALTRDKQVIVTEQYRVGPQKVCTELVGGFVDPGEDHATAAERELLEETGYKPGHMEYLGPINKDTYHNATWHYYLATDCEDTGRGLDIEETEAIELKRISIDEFIANAKANKMTDHGAVLLALDKLVALRDA